MRKNVKPPTGGNCFINTGRFIIANTDKKFRLVHGIVINRIDGKPMSHAWIEFDEFVYDCSILPPLLTYKDQYYELGKITKTIKYTRAKALKMMDKYEFYGHWELGNLR